jgi:hypothetical protein
MKGANITNAFHNFKQNYVINNNIIFYYLYTKGKANLLQAWTGLEGNRNLRLPDFMTIGCQPFAPAAFTPQDILLVLICVGS